MSISSCCTNRQSHQPCSTARTIISSAHISCSPAPRGASSKPPPPPPPATTVVGSAGSSARLESLKMISSGLMRRLELSSTADACGTALPLSAKPGRWVKQAAKASRWRGSPDQPSRWRDYHSAAPPSSCIRFFNRDGGRGVSKMTVSPMARPTSSARRAPARRRGRPTFRGRKANGTFCLTIVTHGPCWGLHTERDTLRRFSHWPLCSHYLTLCLPTAQTE